MAYSAVIIGIHHNAVSYLQMFHSFSFLYNFPNKFMSENGSRSGFVSGRHCSDMYVCAADAHRLHFYQYLVLSLNLRNGNHFQFQFTHILKNCCQHFFHIFSSS